MKPKERTFHGLKGGVPNFVNSEYSSVDIGVPLKRCICRNSAMYLSTRLQTAYISLKSGDMASRSIKPVMFSWLAKCRRRVISRRARFASGTFSRTRVTCLIATVSPEISSAAELSEQSAHRDDIKGQHAHHDAVRARAHFTDELPALLDVEHLPEWRE
jgi:hypothetical protein